MDDKPKKKRHEFTPAQKRIALEKSNLVHWNKWTPEKKMKWVKDNEIKHPHKMEWEHVKNFLKGAGSKPQPSSATPAHTSSSSGDPSMSIQNPSHNIPTTKPDIKPRNLMTTDVIPDDEAKDPDKNQFKNPDGQITLSTPNLRAEKKGESKDETGQEETKGETKEPQPQPPPPAPTPDPPNLRGQQTQPPPQQTQAPPQPPQPPPPPPPAPTPQPPPPPPAVAQASPQYDIEVPTRNPTAGTGSVSGLMQGMDSLRESEVKQVLKEDKMRGSKSIQDLKDEIRAYHKVYDGKIAMFKTKAHKADKDKALMSKDITKVRHHHMKMEEAIRTHFKTAQDLKVGVILSAESLGISTNNFVNLNQLPTHQLGQAPPSANPNMPIVTQRGQGDRFSGAIAGDVTAGAGGMGVYNKEPVRNAVPKNINLSLRGGKITGKEAITYPNRMYPKVLGSIKSNKPNYIKIHTHC